MDIKLGRVKTRTRTTFASKRLKSSWLIRKQKGLLTWAILTSASLWYRALHSSVLTVTGMDAIQTHFTRYQTYQIHDTTQRQVTSHQFVDKLLMNDLYVSTG